MILAKFFLMFFNHIINKIKSSGPNLFNYFYVIYLINICRCNINTEFDSFLSYNINWSTIYYYNSFTRCGFNFSDSLCNKVIFNKR